MNYINNKLIDKLLLTIMIMMVFTFLYTTLDKLDTGYDTSDLGNCFSRSLAISTFRFDVFSQKNTAFALVMCQAILIYVVMLL